MSKPTKKGRTDAERGRRGKPVPTDARFEKVFEKIYRLVLRIPRGRVMTYGQIARLLEERYSPRLVGWAMHATPHDARNIPWHRVINSRGGVSTGRVILAEPERQRLMLEAEGVVFDSRGNCDLSVYQWSPRQRAANAKLKSLRGNKLLARSNTVGRSSAPVNTRTGKRKANGNNSRKTKAHTPKV
ncbi:MAG TPA: MGMT family protein [Blastocatellia bacterium]|nr:MGMT family protein [Blastocatellia bacterium]